mmetsp:Transcript_93171/g.268135  ORF Transcript_93171/g.268135 Transcript_93171/m.268135 type:complete len:237 (-) Transcript_93171:953-1663(-)
MLECRTCRCTRSSLMIEDVSLMFLALCRGSFAATGVPPRRAMTTTPKPPRPRTRSGKSSRSSVLMSQCSLEPTFAMRRRAAGIEMAPPSAPSRSRPANTLPVFVVLAILSGPALTPDGVSDCRSDASGHSGSSKSSSRSSSMRSSTSAASSPSCTGRLDIVCKPTRYFGLFPPVSTTTTCTERFATSSASAAGMDWRSFDEDASATRSAKRWRSSGTRRSRKQVPRTFFPKKASWM